MAFHCHIISHEDNTIHILLFDGYLGCFQTEIIMNRVAGNILVCLFVNICTFIHKQCISVGYTPRCGTAR